MSEHEDLLRTFIRTLAEDYGYSADQISSDMKYMSKTGEGEADLVVFYTKERATPLITVELKSRLIQPLNSDQFRKTLVKTGARYGVLTDGRERICYEQVEPGTIVEIPDIPRRGEGTKVLRKSALKVIDNPEYKLWKIASFLRSSEGLLPEQLFNELNKLLLCKIADESSDHPAADFWISPQEADALDQPDVQERLLHRIRSLFDTVKSKHPDLFPQTETLRLGTKAISHIVIELQSYSISNSVGAVIAAYKKMVGNMEADYSGQFFTPENVASLIVQLLDPKAHEAFLDPASGSGELLLKAMLYVWSVISESSKDSSYAHEAKVKYSREKLFGIDINEKAVNLSKMLMLLRGDGHSNIFVGDTLSSKIPEIEAVVSGGGFDVIAIDPPLIPVVPDLQVLMGYELGKALKKPSIMLLLMEKCLKMLKPRGRMAIVVPDGFLFDYSFRYARRFVLDKAFLRAVISLGSPFLEYGVTLKASVLVLEKKEKGEKNLDYNVFMAARREELGLKKNVSSPSSIETIVILYKQFSESNLRAVEAKKDVYIVPASNLSEDRWDVGFRAPEYEVKELKEGKRIRDFASEVIRGIRIPTREYLDEPAESAVPYIRVMDIVNGKISKSRLKYIRPRDFHSQKSRLRRGDILFSNTGTIGKVALVGSELEGAQVGPNLLVLRVDESVVKSEYLCSVLKTDAVQNQLLRLSYGSTIMFLSISNFKNIVVPVPPIEEQERRLSKIRSLESQVSEYRLKKDSFADRLSRIVRGED